MRTVLAVAALLVLSSGAANADKKKQEFDKKDIDSESLRLLHDGDGHYILLAKIDKQFEAFYGNGKRFHQMTGYTIGKADRTKGGFQITDPRVRGAEFRYDKSGGSTKCFRSADRDKVDETKLTDVSDKEVLSIFKKAKLYKPVPKRKPHVLARDALGIYYYVDRIDELDLRGFRLYVGEAGKMKRMSLKNIASDTVGQVFATKKGALKVRRGAKRLEAYAWVQPNRRDKYELVNVPPRPNQPLIYSTLGVYGEQRLGTFCDDL